VKNHFRRNPGDIVIVAQATATLGLLNAITVVSQNRQIADERRLRATQFLGWQTIPAHIVDLIGPLISEGDENTCRKDFTISERVAIVRLRSPWRPKLLNTVGL
jgi:ParB family chromosome partitioning protein